MNKCVWCDETIVENADYFFYWEGQKVVIKPGFKFPLTPSICPECLALRIQKYIDERKSFVEKFIEIKNNEISVNMKNFWEACRYPNVITEDGYGWDVEDFWWAIGIVTAQNRGYCFNWGGGHIDLLKGRQGYYSFISKEAAIEYVKHEFAGTGVRTTRGICLIAEYISPEEIF
ncbi:MAG TPA: hypothetical protein PKU93_03325 [Candidatus Pacearchaeota archaeon]|nr:hypothetical protein [Candidatus Pacearchaeota archaeon]